MPKKRTHPITRQELDQVDAQNPERLYKKKFAALREELGEELAQKALGEWLEKQRRMQGGIMTVLPPDPKMGRPKYVPLLDKQALVSLRDSIRVPSHALSKRMGWPKYMWSRLENGAVNFSLERGVEICATLRVDIRTLLLPQNRANVGSILGTYHANLESSLIGKYIEDWIESEGGQDEVLDSISQHLNPEDLATADDDQKSEWVTDCAGDAIGKDWQEDTKWADLLVIRSRMESADQQLEETFNIFFQKKNELEIFFSEITENFRKGLLALNSTDGVKTEVKHTQLCLELQELWQELDKVLVNGTLPSGIDPGLLENPANEQTIWIANSKAEEEMIAAAPSWNEMNPDHPDKWNPDGPFDDYYRPDKQEVQSAGAPPPQSASQLPQLPIYGSARAGSDSIDLARGAAALSWTERPYFLAGVGNAYGCYVNSDSMYPVYSEGVLLFVHPSKPVRKGDDCIVEVQQENKEPIGLVKRLLRKSSEKYVFEQFNPPARIEFAASDIKTLHLVVGSLTSGS